MKNVFLIAPYQIDPKYQEKKTILRNLCDNNSLQLLIAEDRKTGKSLNVEETITLLQVCDFAIADLSHERPSCYYELGYLQALGKSVYLICRHGTTLHQALELDKVKVYSDLNSYESILSEIIETCKKID